MYQSVFVIAEERRECVIATEVSQNNHFFISISADRPFQMHHGVPCALFLTGAPTFIMGDDAISRKTVL